MYTKQRKLSMKVIGYSLLIWTIKYLSLVTPSSGMRDLSLVLVEELLSSSKTPFLTLHALPSLPNTPRNTFGYGFPSTRTRLRSVIPEEGVTRERYLGVRDVLREESFFSADYVWFVSGNLSGKICQI